MKIDKLKSVLLDIAPTLATSLIPGGPLVGLAVKTLSKAIFGHESASVEEINAAPLTPDVIEKIKAGERDLVAKLAAIDLRKDELVVEDRRSSREREIKYLDAGRQDVRGDILAYSAISALIVTVFLAFSVDLSQDQQLLVAGLIGSLTVIVKDVYGHHFGSSRGSEQKTAALMRKDE